jgi:cation transporter-like permease
LIKALIAIQLALLAVIGWIAYKVISWTGSENWALLGLFFIAAPAVIIQAICMAVVLWRTSGRIEDGDGVERGAAMALPAIGLIMCLVAFAEA